MRLNRRALLKHFGATAGVAAVAGCATVQEDTPDESTRTTAGDEPGGTAKAWYGLSETEVPLRESVIESFNEESRHTIEGADLADLKQKTTSAIPAGQGPKTFEHAHDLVGDYFERGFVVDQAAEIGVDLNTYIGSAREAIQYQDNVVGLPHDAETVTLMYNADVVDEPPETVADMVAVMDEYHNPDEGKYGLSYFFDPYFTSAWLQAFGGYYFDPSKEQPLGIDRQETVRGLEFVLDTFKPYMPADPKYQTQSAVFAEGNAAFAFNGPWYLSALKEKDLNYEVTTLPSVDGGDPNPYTGITMWYFSKDMSTDDVDTTAAREFVEWFTTNEDVIRQRAEEQGAVPVLESLVGDDDLPNHVTAFAETVDQGTPMPTDPKVNKVWPPMRAALVEAFNGDATPEAALTTAAETVREKWG